MTGDHARTDVRLGRLAGTPSPARLRACLAAWTSLPLTSSLAQPASTTTDRHRAHGKGPPPSALSAGALRALGAAFNSDLSPWGAAGHQPEGQARCRPQRSHLVSRQVETQASQGGDLREIHGRRCPFLSLRYRQAVLHLVYDPPRKQKSPPR